MPLVLWQHDVFYFNTAVPWRIMYENFVYNTQDKTFLEKIAKYTLVYICNKIHFALSVYEY